MSELLWFRRDKAFRGLRFKRHQAREEALDRICKEFAREAGRKTIVGFGDWSNNDPGDIIKGHRSGPVKALVRWLRRCCIAVPIDEHRTSMLHHRCHRKIVGQRIELENKDGLAWLRESYSARYCETCYDAWNMLTLAERKLSNQPIPVSFRRGVRAKRLSCILREESMRI